ncbi:6-bladed beta-propeller [Maribellus comscasis]|uniref:6-bladed beta-propeller n=1 Tax=Maribellus comscasis TaxID=2681766 RepID=A0A6I6JV29_9BACT|nr:6-bladed beta-propeller [Maribellus comscasis]QGY46985.1 6-bladed beta-propeller [Maribellus comscasis]
MKKLVKIKWIKILRNEMIPLKVFMKLLKLSLIFVIILGQSCDSKKNTFKKDPNAYYSGIEKAGAFDVVVCDISKITKKVKLPISKLIDNCELVYLKTPDILPELRRYDVSENFICVAGEGEPVKLFKRNGTFITDIGKIGRGPGEYGFTPNQIIIEEESNSIFLIPAFGVDKIHHFDLEGNFVESITLLYKSPKAQVQIKSDTITVISMVFDDQTPIAYQQSFDGKIIQRLPIIKNLISKPNFDNEIISTFNTNSLDFQIASEDTLFHYNVTNNILEPQLVFMPIQNSIKPIIYEFPNYYYASGRYKKGGNKYERWDVIINRENLETVFCDEIVNDFYGGITNRLFGCRNGRYIASKPAIKLINEITQILKENEIDNQMKQKLKEILDHTQENDNDVLFIGKLKK